METEQFHTFFLPKLNNLGYDSIFSQKSRAKTMSESDAKHVDGCAIFFKRARFRLINHHTMEFNQLAVKHSEGSDDMLNRVMPKDNICIAALLEVSRRLDQVCYLCVELGLGFALVKLPIFCLLYKLFRVH